MQTEISTCPLCHSDPPADRVAMESAQAVECPRCSLAYCTRFEVDAAPSGDGGSTSTLHDYTARMLAPTKKELDRAAEIGRNRVSWFTEALGRPPSILEVGCGAGILGEAMLAAGATYVGLDLDPRVAEMAMSKGLDVRCCNFSDFESDQTFDVVTASQVIEHVLEPHEFVSRAHRLLAEDGILHVEVPNHRSLAGLPSRRIGRLRRSRYGGLEPPHHCMAHTTASITKLLEPFDVSTVFEAHSDDVRWGQIGGHSLSARGYYATSKLVRCGNLVVGLGFRGTPTTLPERRRRHLSPDPFGVRHQRDQAGSSEV